MHTQLVLAVCVLVVGVFMIHGGVQAQDAAPVFKAGAAVSNANPPLGTSLAGNMRDNKSVYIHDDINVRCLVLDDGTTRLAFAIVDSCMLLREVTDDAKQQIEEAIGLPPEQVTISAVHSHNAPASANVFQTDADAAYMKFLATRISDGVRNAVTNLRPARIAFGTAQVPDQVFNRRWHMKTDQFTSNPFGGKDKVKMNPPRGHEELDGNAGPIDPEVSFIFVTGQDHRPIGLLANYSLHYIGGAGGGHVSADYYGYFAEMMKERLAADTDPAFVAMMTNGTSADINNINFGINAQEQHHLVEGGRLYPYQQMGIVADRVASAVCDSIQNVPLAWQDYVTLGAAARDIELGVRKPTAEELVEAKAKLEGKEGTVLQGLADIYARESVLLNEYPDTVPVTIQALRIGDIGIAALSTETFVEIGLEVKEKSPLQPVFTISLANGYNGYLPTTAQHALGGYETWRARSSYLEVEAEGKITAVLFELMDALAKQE